jgi:hypothetical protein
MPIACQDRLAPVAPRPAACRPAGDTAAPAISAVALVVRAVNVLALVAVLVTGRLRTTLDL